MFFCQTIFLISVALLSRPSIFFIIAMVCYLVCSVEALYARGFCDFSITAFIFLSLKISAYKESLLFMLLGPLFSLFIALLQNSC